VRLLASTRRRGAALVAVALVTVTAGSCSTTEEIGFDPSPPVATTTTIDELGSAELAAGADGLEALQSLIDKLLASNDTCAILTQRDVAENRLDPTLFTNTAARKALTAGLVSVFDHLIQISPPQLTPALQSQKDVFQKVLDIVDRYAAAPNETKATEEINVLVDSQSFVTASAQVSQWVGANCQGT